MKDADRFKLLHGPYRAPVAEDGVLFCEIRGWVKVRRMSDGRIPWPQTIAKRSPAFIINGDLVNAILRESATSICFWWGVTPQTVTVWRKALGVAEYNHGTRKLHSRWTPDKLPPKTQEAALEKANAPSMSAAKRAGVLGRVMSKKQARALSRGRRKAMSAKAQQKAGETRRQRGDRPPAAGRPWEPWEDALLRVVPMDEVARRTARTLGAVYCRRRVIGLPDGRRQSK